jgi:hypothetical protein
MKKLFVKNPVSQGEDGQNLFEYCGSQWFPSTAQTGRELVEVTARGHCFKDISKPNIELPIR